jgi:hypothetical protein
MVLNLIIDIISHDNRKTLKRSIGRKTWDEMHECVFDR